MTWPDNMAIYKITVNNCSNVAALSDNWPKSVDTIYINDSSSINIKWPSTLHTLKINHAIALPESLHTLLYDAALMINSSALKDYIPKNLHTLEFSDAFNSLIPEYLDLSRLNTLKFGANFNQYIQGDLQSLETLIFKSHFNRDMTYVSIPSINFISFGPQYCYELCVWLTLETLILGSYFDQKLTYLPKLKILIFDSSGYNQTFDDIALPELCVLSFKYYCRYNQDISKLHAPKLTSLIFSGRFNNDINDIKFPLLEILTLGNEYNKNININFPSIKILTFGKIFRQDISHIRFEKIETIFDYSCVITKKSNNFPNTLYEIIHILPVSNNKITIYKRNTGQRTKAAR
jgi:hypothetical protein